MWRETRPLVAPWSAEEVRETRRRIRSISSYGERSQYDKVQAMLAYLAKLLKDKEREADRAREMLR
jgi:hypothetical protein